MRLAFMGSPAFAVPALLALHGAGHQIMAVYTQKPRPANRGHVVTRCTVHEAAEALGLEVRTPERLRGDDAAQADFAALGLDAAVVAAYGLILPPAMLAAPARGCLNIHASLLPRWRGAAPIQRAMLAGDAQTGVTIMRMEQGLDTGPMLLREALPIGPHDTQPMVQDRLAAIGAALILRALDENPPEVPQPDAGASYAAKLTRADGALDFTRPAADLARQVRALKPWPGTFADFGGEILKVLEAEVVTSQNPSPAFREREGPVVRSTPSRDAKRWECEGTAAPGFIIPCGQDSLRLLRVQRPGRPPVSGEDYLRGTAGKGGG